MLPVQNHSRPHLTKRNVFGFLICLWVGTCGYFGYGEYSKLAVKKRVTMTLKSGERAVFVFSAAQPDNEVVYAMKTQYIPRLETSPVKFVGLTSDEPYQQFLRERIPPKLWRFVLVFFGPPLAWLSGLWACRWLLRRFHRRAVVNGRHHPPLN